MTTLQATRLLLLGAAMAGPALAHAAPTAEAIVAASKAATGGAAWDKHQGCTERGTHGDGAIAYLTRFSLRDYGMRTDSERGGNMRSRGFDGKASWQVEGPGKAESKADPAALREAILTNYLSVNGFFFPDRFPARLAYVRMATEGSRRFDVIRMTPEGGRPLEAWFDRRTHLIQRVVDAQGEPPVRVEASDYRRTADGLMVAYRLDVFGADGALADRGALTSFECGAIDPAIFAPPVAR